MINKSAQGEIFGIALFFVVLIVGILIFTNISALNTDLDEDSFEARQFSILASDSLNAIKKMSTSCQIERDRDSVEDVIRYCFDFAQSSQHDPSIQCGSEEKRACAYSLELINESLQNFFNASEPDVASIPFSLSLSNPDFEHEVWHDKVLTNVEDYGLSLNGSEDDFYLRRGFSRENAGFDIITTGRREVELVFDVYYR